MSFVGRPRTSAFVMLAEQGIRPLFVDAAEIWPRLFVIASRDAAKISRLGLPFSDEDAEQLDYDDERGELTVRVSPDTSSMRFRKP